VFFDRSDADLCCFNKLYVVLILGYALIDPNGVRTSHRFSYTGPQPA